MSETPALPPAPSLSDTEIQDLSSSKDDGGEWNEVRSRSKRKKRSNASVSSSASNDTVRSINRQSFNLTVIFATVNSNQRITSLSSLRVSQALEKLCPECIVQVRYNRRFDVIAVETRNGQTSGVLLRCTELCGMPVKVYEPLPRPCVSGLIRDVDSDLSDDEIAQHLRSPEQRVAKIHRLGQSSKVKVTFCGASLPRYVFLGHVRLAVLAFQDRPMQCRNCWGYNHRAIACNKPAVCGHCGGVSHGDATCATSQTKCPNCEGAHEASSVSCPKWKLQKNLIDYAKTHGVDRRTARSAVRQPLSISASSDFPLLPLTAPDPTLKRRSPVTPSIRLHPAVVNESRTAVKNLPPPIAESSKGRFLQGLSERNLPRPDHQKSSPVFVPAPPLHLSHSTNLTSASSADQPRASKSHPSLPTNPHSEVSGWGPVLIAAAKMACTLLATITAPWARSVESLICAVLPLLGAY